MPEFNFAALLRNQNPFLAYIGVLHAVELYVRQHTLHQVFAAKLHSHVVSCSHTLQITKRHPKALRVGEQEEGKRRNG
jgi:hypothetical protein